MPQLLELLGSGHGSGDPRRRRLDRRIGSDYYIDSHYSEHGYTTPPESLLPLPDAELEILLALVGGEAHGYAMMQAVEQRSGGRTRLGPGTLYAALKRLLASRLIEESGERRDPERDDARRRYYRLSDFGSRVLKAELDRLSGLVRHGRRRLRLSTAGGRS